VAFSGVFLWAALIVFNMLARSRADSVAALVTPVLNSIGWILLTWINIPAPTKTFQEMHHASC
jgi:hypothetical protein